MFGNNNQVRRIFEAPNTFRQAILEKSKTITHNLRGASKARAYQREAEIRMYTGMTEGDGVGGRINGMRR